MILSLFYGWQAFQIRIFSAHLEVFTAQTFPIALSAAGIIASLLLLVLPDEDPSFVKRLKKMDWRSTGMLFLCMFAYALVFNLLGFFIATFLFLNAGFYILGERHWLRMLAVSSVLIVIFWLLLNYLLGIYIDPGFLFTSWLDVG